MAEVVRRFGKVTASYSEMKDAAFPLKIFLRTGIALPVKQSSQFNSASVTGNQVRDAHVFTT